MRYAYLNQDNEPVPTDDRELAWRKDRIKQEHYKGYFVSTVFLPLDHSLGGGPPVHFETYVFHSDGISVTEWCEVWGKRAVTYAEAIEHHAEAIRAIDAGELPQRGRLPE